MAGLGEGIQGTIRSLKSTAARHPTTARVITASVFLAISIAITSVDFIASGPEAKRVEVELVSELKALPLPDETTLVQEESHSKPRIAFVEAEFLTPLDDMSLRKHYDLALARSGWSRRTRAGGTSGQADHEVYVKGDYTAHLELGLHRDLTLRSFRLVMSWGL